ncbi:acyltransferase family protein [Streptococcus zalophi]|uniref:Acyltransferase family protein n=1 Tax=Streptococcus zalophi TaxID=640031 RepID=A0A934UD24_9STRE|nr:acyltransferase family protein [Streptococcus zalophi]MBJ8349336.1 acyltransferase family protein [Streptococcus zalophi]
MKQIRYWDFIDISKGIGILLVVLGHSFPDATSKSGISVPFFRMIESLIYTFHMPLFFFISGFLAYNVVYEKETFNSVKKLKKLVIPYLFMSIVYIPLRLFASGLAVSKYDTGSFWKILIGVSPNGGLWFLYVLALSIIISYYFLTKKNIYIFLIIFTTLSFLTRGLILNPSYSVLKYLCYNYVFFIIGIIFKRYSKTFFSYLKKINWLFIPIVFLIIFYPYYYYDLSYFAFLLAIIGILMVLKISFLFEKRETHAKKFLSYLGKTSMYIYLLHGPLLVVLRFILWRYLKLDYTICVCLMFSLSLIFSILIFEYIIRYSSLLNWLLTGVRRKSKYLVRPNN